MPLITSSGIESPLTFEAGWEVRLMQLGIPQGLAQRMAPDVASLGISPCSVTSVGQLLPIMEQSGFQVLDWWTDLQAFLQQLVAALPSIVLIGMGGGLLWFLRNLKIKGVPVGLVGLIPLGFGMFQLIQQLQSQTSGGV